MSFPGPEARLTLDVIWSYRSPYCYLSLNRLIDIARMGVFVNVKPIYPLAVRKADFFSSVNPKYRKYNLLDTKRISEFLGVPYRRPVPDPIIQDMETNAIAKDQPYIRHVTRLGAAAQELRKGLAFLDTVSRMIWDGSTDNWHEPAKLIDAMNGAGLDGAALDKAVNDDPDRFEKIIADNQLAHDASDHWGTPLMIFNGETFFGQDRIELLIWRMRQSGL